MKYQNLLVLAALVTGCIVGSTLFAGDGLSLTDRDELLPLYVSDEIRERMDKDRDRLHWVVYISHYPAVHGIPTDGKKAIIVDIEYPYETDRYSGKHKVAEMKVKRSVEDVIARFGLRDTFIAHVRYASEK